MLDLPPTVPCPDGVVPCPRLRLAPVTGFDRSRSSTIVRDRRQSSPIVDDCRQSTIIQGGERRRPKSPQIGPKSEQHRFQEACQNTSNFWIHLGSVLEAVLEAILGQQPPSPAEGEGGGKPPPLIRFGIC